MEQDIFISYSRKDSQIVDQFVSEITKAGYTIWIDKNGINSGEQFKTKIVHAIKKSSIILFFSSANANTSDWTVKEIGYALKKEKTIIPIKLDNSEYNDSIDFDLVNIDFIEYDAEHFEQTAKRLISSIQTHLGSRSPSADSNSEKNSDSAEAISLERVYMLGKTYYGINDYEQAVKLFRSAAEQGYAQAQKDLGDCYFNGYGVNQNYVDAVKWYTLAAMQGHTGAQNSLGDCYSYGYGVIQNHIEAAIWFKLAAEQDFAEAQNNLGKCLYDGNGVEQDYKEAVKWFRLAAEQGHDDAQNNLGRCYYYGQGIDQDYNEAAKWFKLSAEQGNTYAQTNLGHCYEHGNGVKKDVGKAYDLLSKNPENQEDIISVIGKSILYILLLIWIVYRVSRLISEFL